MLRKLPCLLLLLTACSSEPGYCTTDAASPAGVALRFADPDVSLADFWEHPWPADVRRKNGQLLLQQFPNPTQSETLSSYLSAIAPATPAFSRSAPSFLSFSGEVDASKLPADPKAAVEDSSVIRLVDIDPSSPEKGRRFPLALRASSSPTTYLPANHLIALVPFGVPLRPHGIYALLVLRGLTAKDGSTLVRSAPLERALSGGCQSATRLEESFAPLRAYLKESGLDPAEIVGATVFTTQDAVSELREMAEVVRKETAPSVSHWENIGSRDAEWEVVAEAELPSFQSGNPPYSQPADGGAIARGADGAFHVDHRERAKLSFSIPRGKTMPPEGWPVVLFAHGTGGSHTDAFDEEVGDALAKLGIAVIGYDGVLHGPRDPTGSNPDLNFFNLFNIRAARDNVRQGAIDNVVMTQIIASGIRVPSSALNGDPEARFDPTKMAYLGHSQGGLVGVPFAAIDATPRAFVFSGTGGILAITLEERKNPLDFLGLLRSLLKLPDAELIDDMHPVLSLIQAFIEGADPIAYGPALIADPPGARPADVLQVEGMDDDVTPPRTHEALASATGLPVITPLAHQPVGSELIGLAPQEGPAKENVQTKNGKITAGLIQYPGQTHFPIYYSALAQRRFIEFLRSGLLEARAVILEQDP